MKLKDLNRGMRCTRRDGEMFVVEEVSLDDSTVFHRGELKFSYLSDCLLSRIDKCEGDIMVVEDITVDGFKVIWERPEEKYYLKLPNPVDDFVSYLNYYEKAGTYMFDNKTGTIALKAQFTQEEIDKLPDQKLIKCLIKEEVK